jgi:hypothetical protein
MGRINVGRIQNAPGYFYGEFPENFLVVLEQALLDYGQRYHEELGKHSGCGTSSSTGCLMSPGNTCDADLASLYGGLADIHSFLTGAQISRRERIIDGTVAVPGGASQWSESKEETKGSSMLFDENDLTKTSRVPKVKEEKVPK